MPSSANSRAVPPVETIAIPSSPSPRAKSTNPRLSETLSRALRTWTAPGATASTPRGSVRAIASFVDVDQPRIVLVDPDAPFRDQAHCTRQQPVLNSVRALLDLSDVPRIRKLEGLLQDDRAGSHPFVNEVHRPAHHLHAVVERLLDRVRAWKRGQQGGMDVDHPGPEAPDELRIEELHEAGEHHEVDGALLEPAAEGAVAGGPVGVFGDGKDSRLHAGSLGADEPASRGRTRRDGDDVDPVAPVHRVQQRLEVGSRSRDEDCDPQAHAARRNTGYGPPVVSSRPSSISSSTRERMSARRRWEERP